MGEYCKKNNIPGAMNILMLTDGIQPFAIGGMQKHSQQVAKFLAEAGHTITLFHCVYHREKFPDTSDVIGLFGEALMKNLECHTLAFPRMGILPGHYIRESYQYSIDLFERCKDRLGEYDFIYAKGFTAWYFLEKKRRGMKMPPIGVKFHGYEMFQKPATIKMMIEHYMLRGPVKWNTVNADYVFSYGGKITPIIKGMGVTDDKIIEVPSGISPDAILDAVPSKTSRRWLFIGRFERRKGIEEIHSAIESLGPEFGIEFHFIGPIPESRRLRQKNTFYHGLIKEREQINQLMDTCEVLLAPSHSEGMPNVILEGMSRGLSVIATDVGAVSRVMDSVCGWWVEPGNVNSLMEVMKAVKACSPEEIREKNNHALQKISGFAWPAVISLMQSEISKVL